MSFWSEDKDNPTDRYDHDTCTGYILICFGSIEKDNVTPVLTTHFISILIGPNFKDSLNIELNICQCVFGQKIGTV